MKKRFFCLTIAFLLVLSAVPLYSAEQPEAEDRFQLFNAEYNSALIQTSKTTVFSEKNCSRSIQKPVRPGCLSTCLKTVRT